MGSGKGKSRRTQVTTGGQGETMQPLIRGTAMLVINRIRVDSLNTRVGQVVEIVSVKDESVGPDGYEYRIRFADKALADGIGRGDLYLPGDKHLDAAFLRKALLRNLAWRGGRRVPMMDGVYWPAVGYVGDKYEHLVGKRVLVPVGVPVWLLGAAQAGDTLLSGDRKCIIAPGDRTVTVVRTTPGSQAAKNDRVINRDPLVFWDLGEGAGCAPADLVWEVDTRVLRIDPDEFNNVSF